MTTILERKMARLPVYLLAAIVMLGAALRLNNFAPEIGRTPDERTYTRQAEIVLAMGKNGFRYLGAELERNLPAVSRDPSPLRAGYISLVMTVMRLTHDPTALAGAHLSLCCSLLALVLLALMAYRYLSPTVAIVATLFYAVSPFDLTTFRRSWEEAYISLLTIAMLTLATLIARSKDGVRVMGFCGFAVLGFLAWSTKENSGLTFLLCAAGLTAYFVLQRDRSAAVTTAASAAVAVLGYVLLMAILFGGVVHSLTLVKGYAHYSGINPYSVMYDSGPVYLFPEGLFVVSPFVFVLGAIGFVMTVRRAIQDGLQTAAGLPLGIALLTASILLLQVVTHRYSFRYSAPIFGPLCLLAAMGVDAVLPALRKWMEPLGRAVAWAVIGFAIAVAAYHDWNFALEKQIAPQTQDLALRPILDLPPAPVPPDYPR